MNYYFCVATEDKLWGFCCQASPDLAGLTRLPRCRAGSHHIWRALECIIDELLGSRIRPLLVARISGVVCTTGVLSVSRNKRSCIVVRRGFYLAICSGQ